MNFENYKKPINTVRFSDLKNIYLINNFGFRVSLLMITQNIYSEIIVRFGSSRQCKTLT